jgi:hypothetical protein
MLFGWDQVKTSLFLGISKTIFDARSDHWCLKIPGLLFTIKIRILFSDRLLRHDPFRILRISAVFLFDHFNIRIIKEVLVDGRRPRPWICPALSPLTHEDVVLKLLLYFNRIASVDDKAQPISERVILFFEHLHGHRHLILVLLDVR